MREITVTLTEKQWQSILEGEWSDLAGFDEGVVDTISKALCPNGHTDSISWKRTISTFDKPYVWVLNHCAVCLCSLWGIWHESVKDDTYRYWDAISDEQIIFLVGGPDDPQKIDIASLLAREETHREWQKL